jgi:hypothetical protein
VLLNVATQLQAEGRMQFATMLLQLVRERYPNTPAAAEANRLLALGQQNRVDESGRTELIVFGTTYGAALGIAIPVAFESEDEEAYGLGLIAGAPLGFLASRAYARSRPLSEGQASAIISGALWGTWQAYGWSEVLDLGEEEFCDNSPPPGPFCYESGPDADEVMRTMIAGSVVGLGVGALLSKKNITPGTAATVNFGALWGSWFGIATAILADQENDALMTTLLLGGNAGMVAGAIGNTRWRWSESRARLISISGLGGLLAGFGVLLIAQPSDADNTAVLVPLGGSIAGLALGARWTRNMDRDALIDVGHRRLGFELPTVQPTMRDKGATRVAGIRVNLVQARF